MTKQEQAVVALLAAGPVGFADRIKAHADQLEATGDVAGLLEFTEALITLSQELRGLDVTRRLA